MTTLILDFTPRTVGELSASKVFGSGHGPVVGSGYCGLPPSP